MKERKKGFIFMKHRVQGAAKKVAP